MTHQSLKFLILAIIGLAVPCAYGEDAFYYIPVSELGLESGPTDQSTNAATSQYSASWDYDPLLRETSMPYGILDGEGEIYFDPTHMCYGHDCLNRVCNLGAVTIRALKGQSIKGRLVCPKEGKGMTARAFQVDPAKANQHAKADFARAKENHYRRLANRNISGAAYFRHLADQAKKPQDSPETNQTLTMNRSPMTMRPARNDTLDETYHLFTGGRALSENIQLDRVLTTTQPKAEIVDVTTIPGITIESFDWKRLLQGKKPELDSLAAFVPADQYALYFKSFQDMLNLIDEAKDDSAPILETLESRAERAMTQERYERQLLVPLNDFVRIIGPEVIQNAVLTGSDPYLRTGSDIALILDTKDPVLVTAFLESRYALEAAQDKSVKEEKGNFHGIDYRGIHDPFRTRSSYFAVVDQVIIISNSLYQLRQVVESIKGIIPSMHTLGEYAFFRARYLRSAPDESALLIVTDASIRKWSGPKWRIGASRRIRAAAILADLNAKYLTELASSNLKERKLLAGEADNDLGELTLGPSGVLSSNYGTLDFLTPIAELPISHVSEDEKAAYIRYRDRYQQDWQRFFDPIAIKFSVQQNRLGLDMTVMPLIMETQYRDFMDVTRGISLKPNAGDPHPDALLHFVMALNPKSREMQDTGNFMNSVSPSLTQPLSWLGNSLSVYLDRDPFWNELEKADNEQLYLQTMYDHLPVAVRFDATDGLKLAAFLTSLRAYAEQTSPGLTVWEAQKYNNQGYTKISSSGMGLTLYYAATPQSFLITVNESLLKRALDREAGKTSNATLKNPKTGWLGESVALKIEKEILGPAQMLIGPSYTQLVQLRCWSNIPILNEWRRLFPDRDPVSFHEKLWKTRLICPGGGSYVWNDTWKTMESSDFGHPAEPRGERVQIPRLKNITSANFGLTFEENGLRARVEFMRQANDTAASGEAKQSQ